jgi:hypothetical protein
LELYPGGYTLLCEHGKYVRGTAGIGMPPGGELTHDFELRRRLNVTINPNVLPEGYTGPITVHVELLDEDGNPATGTTTITVNVCGQQIEVTVTDGTGDATVTVGPLGCGRGRHRGPSGPGGQPDPGGPFDPDPNNPTQPPIPPDGNELDDPTFGIGECELEIVEPTTGQIIGGNAKVTLKVTMDQGLSVTIDSVQAQEITDLHAVQWIEIYQCAGGGDPGNPDGGGLTPVSDTVVDGRRVLTYECAWNTLNPETHNFRHRLVATATFSPGGGEMPGGGGTGGVTKTAETQPVVGNLVITDVECSGPVPEGSTEPNRDYVVHDSAGTDTEKHPVVRFTIEDSGEAHEYVWMVYLKPTGVIGWPEEDTSYMWGAGSEPGEVTAQWNSPLNVSSGTLPRGPVTFDIGVWEVDDVLLWEWPEPCYDEMYYRWPYQLQFAEHDLEWLGEDALHARASYTLGDSGDLPASEVDVDLIGPSLTVKATWAPAPVTLYQQHVKDGLYTCDSENEDDWGEFWALFRGVDSHKADYRDHQNHRILPVNRDRPNVSSVDVEEVAVGLRMWVGGATGDLPVLPPEREPLAYKDDTHGAWIMLYAFLRVNVGGDRTWYAQSGWTQAQLEMVGWVARWPSAATPSQVKGMPKWLQDLLQVEVVWRQFGDAVVQPTPTCNGSPKRKYGMEEPTFYDSGLKKKAEVDVGTHWWGARVGWRSQRLVAGGTVVREQMLCLLPTDRRRGSDNSAAVHLFEVGEAGVGYNEVNIGDGQTHKLWLPDPADDPKWDGRISGRAWIDSPTFAGMNTADRGDDDPFFAGYSDGEVVLKQTIQGDFNGHVMEWAYSFLNVPYSWGGQTYGGRQSKGSDDFTCSHDTDPNTPGTQSHRPEGGPPSLIGSSHTAVGYGIDCSGLVGEAAHSAGLGNPDMGAGTMRTTGVARTLSSWQTVRLGDYMASTGHVVYARGEAVIQNGALVSVPTIEADGDANTVCTRSRSSSDLIGPDPSDPRYRQRRWIAP